MAGMRVVLMAAMAWASGGGPGDDAAEELGRLRGTWKPAEAELGGRPFPKQVLDSMSLAMTADGEYTVKVGEGVDKGTFTLDPAARPKAIDIKGVEGPNAGRTLPAIYELDGDTLRVCYELGGGERPSKFATEEGTARFLVTYRREKE